MYVGILIWAPGLCMYVVPAMIRGGFDYREPRVVFSCLLCFVSVTSNVLLLLLPGVGLGVSSLPCHAQGPQIPFCKGSKGLAAELTL